MTSLNRVQKAIHTAYLALSTKRGDWVKLAALADAVADQGISLEGLHRQLTALERSGAVLLAPDSNRKTLTAADHETAIQRGSASDACHLAAFQI